MTSLIYNQNLQTIFKKLKKFYKTQMCKEKIKTKIKFVLVKTKWMHLKIPNIWIQFLSLVEKPVKTI